MKTEKNILIAFLLNFAFSVFEFAGGIITGSVAIVSDAIHDMGDAVSIGISWFLERKSKKQPNERYTYGYGRWSVLGGLITTEILLLGSLTVIYNAFCRLVSPAQIHYNGMILFALIGTCVNFFAAIFTREGDSLNQKAVNLHMLEDLLGWIVVLLGAIIMRFTGFVWLDPVLSIGLSLFILVHAIKNLKEILNLFLEKAPENIEVSEIQNHLEELAGVMNVHHIHLWSMDGQRNYATMHVVSDNSSADIKKRIREEMRKHGIDHVTIELETSTEDCPEKECRVENHSHSTHCHHHH